jgi:hypothetical protein
VIVHNSLLSRFVVGLLVVSIFILVGGGVAWAAAAAVVVVGRVNLDRGDVGPLFATAVADDDDDDD